MPAGAVKDEDGVGTGGYRPGDLGEVEVHRFGIGEGQHEACRNGTSGADGTKDVGPLVPGVALGAGPCATPRPDAGDRALLADACFILEPDLDGVVPCPRGDRSGYRLGEVF